MNKQNSIFFHLNKITSSIPRPHLYAISALALFSIASLTLLPHPNELQGSSQSLQTALPIIQDGDDSGISENPKLSSENPGTEYVSISDKELLGNDSDVADGLNSSDENTPDWTNYKVKGDDNLSVIFDTLNISPAILQQLLSVDKEGSLVHLRIDQMLSFQIDQSNRLLKLSIPLNSKQAILFELKNNTYISTFTTPQEIHQEEEDNDDMVTNKSTQQSDTENTTSISSRSSRLISGTINGAFVHSAKASGLTDRQVIRVVNMFKGRIDFRRDLRKGDSFKVLFDKPNDSTAKIVAVKLTIAGKDFRAFRNDDGQFYDETASNLTSGTFLRFPTTAHFRLSSGFNPSRRNPVTGIVQPHNGTDFAVPIGTKVLATGDGVVQKAANTASTGRYVVLRHNGKYTTVYMHMSKLLVKVGQKVKQGQPIGLSGNTGRSTGPHIHYEFRINNRPVNAMRVDLPTNDGLSAQKKRQFLAKVRQYDTQLDD